MQDYPFLEQYLQSGIGDLSDLEFKTGVAEGGKWVGLVNPGWYWQQARLGYLYSQEGYLVVNSTTSGYQTITIPGVSGTPMLSWAPVTLRSTIDSSKNFTPLSQTYRPMQNLSWTVSGDLAYADVTGLLLSVRNRKGEELGRVAGERDLVDTHYYFLEGSTLYLRSRSTSPDAFADVWTTNLPGSAILQVSELCQAISSTQVYTKHRYPKEAFVQFGYQRASATAVENLITHSLTGVVRGDLLRIDYYVPNSYVVINDCSVGVYLTTGDNFWISYEEASPGTQHFVNTRFGPLQLNPLYGGIRSGYLLMNTSNDYVWSDSDAFISLTTDVKDFLIPEWKEPFRVVAISKDKNGRRLGNINIEWTLPNEVTILNNDLENSASLPYTQYTDDRGECHALCLLSSEAASSFSITVRPFPFTEATISRGDTISFRTQAASCVLSKAHYLSGSLLLYLNTERTEHGARRILGQATYLDQIPWIDQEDSLSNTQIKLLTKSGRLYDDTSNMQIKPIQLIPYNPNQGLGAIQWEYYPPVGLDRLFISRYIESRYIQSTQLTVIGGVPIV